jgi:hypothetical protein
MNIRRLLVPLAVALVSIHAGQAGAQGALSAPQGEVQCMKEFAPLREEAENRGKLIKAASSRHAPPDEACKLISNFGQAETMMIRYVEAHSAECGIPSQIADQLKTGHKNTEVMLTKVCAAARQLQQRGPAGPVGDFDDIGAPPLAR